MHISVECLCQHRRLALAPNGSRGNERRKLGAACLSWRDDCEPVSQLSSRWPLGSSSVCWSARNMMPYVHCQCITYTVRTSDGTSRPGCQVGGGTLCAWSTAPSQQFFTQGCQRQMFVPVVWLAINCQCCRTERVFLRIAAFNAPTAERRQPDAGSFV